MIKTYSPFGSNAVDLNQKNSASSFWLSQAFGAHRNIDTLDSIALAKYRRVVKNFVRILTGMNIPIDFATSGETYTTGDRIVISANFTEKNFDSIVGLALHEAAHIRWTDMAYARILHIKPKIPKYILDIGIKKNLSETKIYVLAKKLFNYVEDRRIDYLVYSTCPGYRKYYDTNYTKFWNSSKISVGLKSTKKRTETVDSYMFRAINITNPQTDLTALKGLKDIWNVLDLDNIERLQNSGDAFIVALDILNIILKNIDKISDSDIDKKSDSPDNNDSNSIPGDNDSNSTPDDNDSNSTPDDIDPDSSSNSNSEGPIKLTDKEFRKMLRDIKKGNLATDGNVPIELTDDQWKKLEKEIKKQKEYIDGNVPKRVVSKKQLREIETIDQNGTSFERVGTDFYNKTDCIVVRNFDFKLIDSCVYSVLSRYNDYSKEVAKGIRLGTILGRKLKIRGEVRDTVYSRKEAGKIDRRLISELGFDNSNIFSQVQTESYPAAKLHISLDGSGSMSSAEKWERTLTATVAIAKSATMIPDLDVVVSIRSTVDINKDRKPLVIILYDSTKDKFAKVRSLFKFVGTGGTTPEGLCYEAIMDEITSIPSSSVGYFLNFSDGMPLLHGKNIYYCGTSATRHTRDMVNKMRRVGIKVISYFISRSNTREGKFIEMYGKDSHTIDVTNIISVANVMNKKFLEK